MSASAAHVATSSCLEAFGALRGHLQAAKPGLAAQVSDADIEDEFGRFRLWAANIGALSRGHGSLDYRLRDAPVVLEGALKLLNELQQELHQMCLVLSGARLPYEAQISSRAGLADDSDASSLSSDSESSSDSSSDSEDEKLAPSELRRRVNAISNINDNLYRLSRSIRAPASHSRSLKALSYKLIDKETGVDVVQQFATVDLAFTKDLFSQLRRNAQDQYGNYPMLDDADVAMIKRLAQGITRRRQQFLYWKHHRKKLGYNAEKEGLKIPKLAPTVQLRGDETRESVAGPRASLPVVGKAQTESSRPKTTLTETTATLFVAPATVLDGNQSVTSYATTARGLDGSRIEFPKLPKSIKKGKDFECPYCLMICPPHYQMPRAWRAHLLRDLRPYMCTHKHCQQSDELFATKQEWLNHEHTHQKAWQCPEHASAHFSTPEDLTGHLLAETHESLERMGLEDLLAICETVRPDSRTTCPICFVDTGSSYGLENHLANHLERFAAFALPRDVDSDADEGSHNDSNMSEHAIARSDQSDVSELSHAYDWHKERIEIIGLARNLTDILSNGSSDTISDLKKLYDQIMRITDLPTEIIDTLSFDLQFNAVLKTIPKLLTELLGVVAPDSDEDNFEELTSELIFQMERLDRIIQEYAVDHALDSSHPRLGINTALSDQNPENRLKQSQTDGEPAPPRDSSPDSIVSRSSSILSMMDLTKLQPSNPAIDDVSPIRDSSLDVAISTAGLDGTLIDTSTQIHDIPPRKQEFEPSFREKLTTYKVFTLVPDQDKTRSTKGEPWANVQINRKSYPTEMIIEEIEELDASRFSFADKMAGLSLDQQSHVNNILNSMKLDDLESQFGWALAQLYCEESVNLKTGEKKIASITVYLRRAPLPDIDVNQLYRERQNRARIQALERLNANILQQVQAAQKKQENNPKVLISNLTLLLTDAYRIQQRLRDFATEDKATPDAIIRLNRIFPDICLGITNLVKTIREGVVDSYAVTYIEAADTRCRRLFEDASSFLDKFKEGTRPSWGSRKKYRNDMEHLVASAQHALQEINYILVGCMLGVQAEIRVIGRGREQDDPTSRPPTGGITLPTENEVSGGLSRAGEHGHRPESSKNSQGTDGILTQGLEEGSEVGHETSDKFVTGQRGSSVPALETRPRMPDSNPQTHDRPIIIDERPLRGILKPGRGKFPDDPSPTREGIAPLGDEMNEGIYLRPSRAEGAPPGARWTKISRLLVSPEALHEGGERYEARDDFVIVLRVLTKEEIQAYTDSTERIRAARAAEDEALYERRSRHAELKARAFEQDGSDVDDEGNNSEYERSGKRELARLPRTRRDSKGKDATNMSSTDKLSNDDVESPSSSVSISLDSNAQKLVEIFSYPYLRQELNKILNDATLRLLFREHLRDTHGEENLSFYLEVDEFLNYCTDVMQVTSPSSLSKVPDRRLDVIKETMASAYGIYNAFLAPGSPYELNIDHSLRSQLASCMNKAVGGDDSMIESLKEVIKLFEEVHLSMFERMADSVPKFFKSAKYEQNRKNYDFDSTPTHPRNKNDGTPTDTHFNERLSGHAQDDVEYGTDAPPRGRADEDVVHPSQIVPEAVIQEEVDAYDSDIPFIGPERPMGPGPPEETEPAAPNEDDLAGFYYGYVRPTNHGLTPIQPTLLEGRTDGDVDVVDVSRWTRINRRFVSPEALDRAHEKYFVWDPYVIVHRILSREEVDAYTTESTSIRAARAEEGSDRRESYDAVGDTYVRPVVPLSVPRGEGDDQPSRLPPSQQDDNYKEGEVKNGRGWRVPGSWSGPEHGYDKDDESDSDNERGWNVPDSWLSKTDNIPTRKPRDEGPRADDVLGEPARPSSATSSIFNDDVILNPHTLPRDSLDISRRMDSAGSSHQSAETDNKRLPGKNYPILPPHPPSAQFNTPPDLTSSTAFAPSLVYPCTFAFAGCSSSSSSKDYWKRHVDSNHMSFVYWECPLKPCPRPLFHTEDLLERHLKWVHEPPDHEIAALVKKGERPGRRLIEEIRCPAPGCIHGWKGIGKLVWDERMEHVAGHWEAVDRGEEVGGWTEEGGGLLEWAIREGAVTKGKGGRLMCQEALGLWRPEKPLNEKTPTYDDAPGPSSTHDRSPFSGDFFEPNPFTRSSTTKSATDQTTNRLEGDPSVEFVPEHRGEPYNAPLNVDLQPRRTESPGYSQISRYTASTSDYDYEDDSTGSRINPRTPLAPSLPPATDLNANLPSSAAADFAAAAKATANATAMLVHQRDHLGVDPTTQETMQRDEGSKPLDNRDVDAALESSSSTNRWTAGLREARQLTKSVSGLARSLSALSTRDKTSPASHETASGDEGKKPIGSAPGPPPPPPRPSSATPSAPYNDDHLELPDLQPPWLQLESPLSLAMSDDDGLHLYPRPLSDVGDETPLDDKSFRRLKRVFSRRNWTEKGKGERRGRDKDKEEDGGGGRRSSLFRSR